MAPKALGQQALPETFIDAQPPASTFVPAAYFVFDTDQPLATFECRYALAGNALPAFTPCTNPLVVPDLSAGDWVLEVRAVNGTGAADPSPAVATWEVTLAVPAGTATLLQDGVPFPTLGVEDVAQLNDDVNSFYINPNAASNGTGGILDPFNQLDYALQQLNPADRLILLPGEYSETVILTNDNSMYKAGTANHPIQVIGTPGAVFKPGSSSPEAVFQVELPWWQFQGLEFDFYDPDSSNGEGKPVHAFLTKNSLFSSPTFEYTAADILIDSCKLYDGSKNGISVSQGTKNLKISNCEIYHFRTANTNTEKHGVVIRADTESLSVEGNLIYGNDGDAIQVNGSEANPGNVADQFATDVSIFGNHLHSDIENAVDIKSSRDVDIFDNLIHQYNLVEDGEGVVIHYDAQDISVRRNHIFDCFKGVVINRGKTPGTGVPWPTHPSDITIERNFLDGSVNEPTLVRPRGIQVGDCSLATVVHNITLHWLVPITITDPDQTTSYNPYICANNLIVDPEALVFEIDSADAEDILDGLLVASPTAVSGTIGNETKLYTTWISVPTTPFLNDSYFGDGSATMQNSNICDWILPWPSPTLKDSGVAYPGSTPVPDIGICEH
ncbi:MAG: right-handed parallel beta-helix repeat-containing protein [Planctomycetota bacterium]|nr:MAG: right-handed parallel beta-helix repeat-containing protein [Planctomycetota bacterium]